MDASQPATPACGLLQRQPVFNRKLETVATTLAFLPCDRATGDAGAVLEYGLQLLGDIAQDPIFGTWPTVVEIPAQALERLTQLAWPLPSRVLHIDAGGNPQDTWRRHLETLAQQGFEYVLSHGTEPCGSGLKPKLWMIGAESLASREASVDIPAPLWATHIDSRTLFAQCSERPSVTWFSGAFWKRPAVQPQRSLPASQVGSLRLLARLQDPEVTVNEVEQIISCDATLTYKLLKLLNSAFFCSPSRVESIHHGVNFFGLQRIKNWATVIVMNAVDFLPREILPLGAYRARLAETLAQSLKRPSAPQYYLVGLFSVLDALFDCTMEQLIGPLNLHDDLARALLAHEGPAGELLGWIIGLEQGEPVWSETLRELQTLDLMRLQLDAQVWTNEFCRCLRSA